MFLLFYKCFIVSVVFMICNHDANGGNVGFDEDISDMFNSKMPIKKLYPYQNVKELFKSYGIWKIFGEPIRARKSANRVVERAPARGARPEPYSPIQKEPTDFPQGNEILTARTPTGNNDMETKETKAKKSDFFTLQPISDAYKGPSFLIDWIDDKK